MVRGWRAEGGEELVEVASDRLRNQFDYDRDRGNIKKFASFVTVIEDGEEVERREIAVNDPLRRAGFRLYQSSYDAKDPRFVGRYDSAFVLVMDSTGSAVQVLNLEPGEPSKVAGDSLSVVAGRLLPDFKIGSGFRPFSGSDQFINPGLELSFAGPNGYRKSEWVLLGLPSRERIGEFQYELKGLAGEDVQMEMMTIFEIKYTFGTSILWAGFLVGTLGLLLSFYMTHRVIYLVWPTPETPHTQVIAASRKIPLQFEKELDRVLGKG